MSDHEGSDEVRAPWARSERLIPRIVVRPLQEFLQSATSAGLLMLAAGAVAIAWANLAASGYERFWRTRAVVSVGSLTVGGDLRFWVNDGLMTAFFLVVGLEIKRELLTGELRDPRRAALPFLAALGGMVVPALLFIAIAGDPSRRAWSAAMPTDIALTLGILAAARSAPPALKAFMVALAIADDIGTIVVLAIFYATGVSWFGLVCAGLAIVVAIGLERIGVRASFLYVALGIVIWLGLDTGGVHPALAGVVVGLLTPAKPFQRPAAVSAEAHRTADETLDDPPSPDADAPWWLRLATLSREAVSPLARIEHAMLPWANHVALPVFALANAGISLADGALSHAVREPITGALVVARVIGKVLGIVGVSWLAVWLGVGRLPRGVRWGHLVGAAFAASMAFTVSLFVVDASFGEGSFIASAAKVGILACLVFGAAASLVTFRLTASDATD